jgi:hypothetical protein
MEIRIKEIYRDFREGFSFSFVRKLDHFPEVGEEFELKRKYIKGDLIDPNCEAREDYNPEKDYHDVVWRTEKYRVFMEKGLPH